jgi:hypothetical protein
MTPKHREKWAFAIIQAMAEYVPKWPKAPTKAQVMAQDFFMTWLDEIGFKMWFV